MCKGWSNIFVGVEIPSLVQCFFTKPNSESKAVISVAGKLIIGNIVIRDFSRGGSLVNTRRHNSIEDLVKIF